jgi:hypothetical protein
MLHGYLPTNLAVMSGTHSGTKPGRDETWSQPSAITFSRCQPVNTSACQLVSTPRTQQTLTGPPRRETAPPARLAILAAPLGCIRPTSKP